MADASFVQRFEATLDGIEVKARSLNEFTAAIRILGYREDEDRASGRLGFRPVPHFPRGPIIHVGQESING
jgi:hypothetical protein